LAIYASAAVSYPAISPRVVPKMSLLKPLAFAGGLSLSMLSYPVHAAAANGSDIVQGLYEALLSTRNTILQRLTWPETRVGPDFPA
jgi:hypothetical protein